MVLLLSGVIKALGGFLVCLALFLATSWRLRWRWARLPLAGVLASYVWWLLRLDPGVSNEVRVLSPLLLGPSLAYLCSLPMDPRNSVGHDVLRLLAGKSKNDTRPTGP